MQFLVFVSDAPTSVFMLRLRTRAEAPSGDSLTLHRRFLRQGRTMKQFLVAVAAIAVSCATGGLPPVAQAQEQLILDHLDRETAPVSNDHWTSKSDLGISYPLHYALSTGLYDEALQLMLYEKDLNVQGPDGETPLTIAAGKNTTDAYDMVFALLQRGADPNAYNGKGVTALHRAACSGTLSVVHLLVDKYGADVDPVPTEDSLYGLLYTPLYCARVERHKRVADFLESRGARLTEQVAKEAAVEARMSELLAGENYDSEEFRALPEDKQNAIIKKDARVAALIAVEESGATVKEIEMLKRVWELLDEEASAHAESALGETENQDLLLQRYTKVFEQIAHEYPDN